MRTLFETFLKYLVSQNSLKHFLPGDLQKFLKEVSKKFPSVIPSEVLEEIFHLNENGET